MFGGLAFLCRGRATAGDAAEAALDADTAFDPGVALIGPIAALTTPLLTAFG
jgi:hypothetical protein